MDAHNLTFTFRRKIQAPLPESARDPSPILSCRHVVALCDVTDQSVLGPEEGSAAVQRSDPGSCRKTRQIWRVFLQIEPCHEVMTLESERVTRVMSRVNNKKGRQVKL